MKHFTSKITWGSLPVRNLHEFSRGLEYMQLLGKILY